MPRTRTTFKKGHKKFGGIQKGGKRKHTVLKELAAKLAPQLNKSPLEILTEIAQTAPNEEIRVRAAQAAAPYVHKRMPQSIELSGELKIQSTFAAAVKEPDETDNET